MQLLAPSTKVVERNSYTERKALEEQVRAEHPLYNSIRGERPAIFRIVDVDDIPANRFGRPHPGADTYEMSGPGFEFAAKAA